MHKKITFILVSLLAVVFSLSASAVTKPSSEADMDSFSYVFYLYYDNGQLFADRDYEVKYDVVSEKFAQAESAQGSYKVIVTNFRSETVKSVDFDPRAGNANLTSGKIQIKAPYASDGQRATFYNNQGQQLVTIFVIDAALCDNNGVCNSGVGENEKTCSSDCRINRTPVASVVPTVLPSEGLDLNTILIYAVGGIGVVVVAWLIWKWIKKKKEENFLPPPATTPSSPSEPPLPPPLQ